RRRHTRSKRDWSSDVCSSDLVVHSSAYRNAEPFRGKDVVVVGSGESAGDLVMDLVDGGAARVWMSIRTPPYIFPASVVGIVQDKIGRASGRGRGGGAGVRA